MSDPSARLSGSSPLPGEPGVESAGAAPFVGEDEESRWLFSLNRFGMRPGLERIEGLLDSLGRPERALRTIVIAGTNGKGSTTRILAQLLRAAGHRTACFTSPHLLRVYERLEIDGQPVAPSRFAGEVRRLRPAIEDCGASWFESLTALALSLCRDEGVEVLCCEAGLGGRLDATNALPAVATVLTSVALDHQHILGDTLAQIAAEKLGLLKAGAPLFCSVPPALRAQVFAAAVAAGSPAWFADEQCVVAEAGESWSLTTRRSHWSGLPRLGAPFLERNAALALLCLDELAAAGRLRRPADPGAALAAVSLPGRFQTILTGPDWIIDTAHNPEALERALEAFLARPCAGRRWALFSLLREKEAGPEVGALLRRCDQVVMAPIALPRARNREELAALTAELELDPSRARLCAGVDQALAELHCGARAADAVLVTGSCFLVAEVLHRLGFRDLRETRPPRPAGAAGAAA